MAIPGITKTKATPNRGQQTHRIRGMKSPSIANVTIL